MKMQRFKLKENFMNSFIKKISMVGILVGCLDITHAARTWQNDNNGGGEPPQIVDDNWNNVLNEIPVTLNFGDDFVAPLQFARVSQSDIQRYSILRYFRDSPNNIGNNNNDYLQRLYELMANINLLNHSNESLQNRHNLNNIFGSILDFFVKKIWRNYKNVNQNIANRLMDFDGYYVAELFENHSMSEDDLVQMAQELHDIVNQNHNDRVEARYQEIIAKVQQDIELNQ